MMYCPHCCKKVNIYTYYLIVGDNTYCDECTEFTKYLKEFLKQEK